MAARKARFPEPRRAAFTLAELLVVIAVIAALLATMLPALARTRPNNQAAQCMNNLRQMMAGLLIYAGDHSDLFPPNPDDSNSFFGHNWAPGYAGGRGKNVLWRPEYLADERRCAILNYIGKNTALFKCPADERTGVPSSGTYAGQTIPAPRTISMNGAVGSACAGWKNGGGHGGVPTGETRAPHLTGTANDPSFHRYNKASTIAAPEPARLWVLLDESEILLNDGSFSFQMTSLRWVDAPGAYHNGAGSFAFADGHFEFKKWKSELTGRRVGTITPATPEEQDYLWMRERTSAPQ